MKVTKEKVENGQAYLTIELEPAEVEAGLQKAYLRLVQKARIPGFRKGKAPRPLVERYLGKESLLEEALNRLVPEHYTLAVEQEKLEPVAHPEFEVTQTEPVIFKAVVPLRPVTTLGDYRSIRIAPIAAEPTEDKVEGIVERLQHQQATWEPVERPARMNDLTVIDLVEKVDDQTILDRKGLQVWLNEDSSFPAPKFSPELVGMKIGEDRGFQLTLHPEHPRKELAGKMASFKVHLSELKEEKLPEMNDDFAKAIDPTCPTIQALREKIASELKAQAEQKAAVEFEEKVLEAAVSGSKVEYPPVLVDNEITRMMQDQAQRVRQAGGTPEDYLKSINKTEAELREEFRPTAVKRLLSSLVLDKVAAEDKIEVSPAEIDAEIEKILTATGDKREQVDQFFKTDEMRESIRGSLLVRKSIARLVEIAKQPPLEVPK